MLQSDWLSHRVFPRYAHFVYLPIETIVHSQGAQQKNFFLNYGRFSGFVVKFVKFGSRKNAYLSRSK